MYNIKLFWLHNAPAFPKACIVCHCPADRNHFLSYKSSVAVGNGQRREMTADLQVPICARHAKQTWGMVALFYAIALGLSILSGYAVWEYSDPNQGGFRYFLAIFTAVITLSALSMFTLWYVTSGGYIIRPHFVVEIGEDQSHPIIMLFGDKAYALAAAKLIYARVSAKIVEFRALNFAPFSPDSLVDLNKYADELKQQVDEWNQDESVKTAANELLSMGEDELE